VKRSRNKFKKYEITYAPTIKIIQEVVDPYDDWNSDNVDGDYLYAPVHNHDREYVERMTVNAVSKRTAEAVFAIKVFQEIPFNRRLRGDKEAYVFDRIRNIVSIEEVKADKENA